MMLWPAGRALVRGRAVIQIAVALGAGACAADEAADDAEHGQGAQTAMAAESEARKAEGAGEQEAVDQAVVVLAQRGFAAAGGRGGVQRHGAEAVDAGDIHVGGQEVAGGKEREPRAGERDVVAEAGAGGEVMATVP